jgi:DNA-binding transcriptional LysR family regulator
LVPSSDNYLHQIDLNLLKIFKAVHVSRQATAAAGNLGLTQPAVSQGLKRLRLLLDDPLFIPTKTGMEPTARANELAGPVIDALSTIERAFRQTSEFQAANSQRRFRIGMLDYSVTLLAPRLAGIISQQAPGVTIEISYVPQAAASQLLLSDALDLVTGPFSNHSSALIATDLVLDRYVVISRRDHAALKGGLTRAILTELPHVSIPAEPGELGNLENSLQAQGVRMQKAVQVPTYAGACFIAGESDFLAILPKRLAEVYQNLCGLAIYDVPVDIPPLQIRALIHRRNSTDAGLKWLIDVLVEAAPIHHAGA